MMQNNTGNPAHPQTMLLSPDGVYISIDEQLTELMSLLWEMGIHTNFSCEGEPTNFSWNTEYLNRDDPTYNEARQRRAYISMANTKESLDLVLDIIHRFPMIGGHSNSMWDFEFSHHYRYGPRICIRLPHNDIPKFVSFLQDDSQELHTL